MELPSGWTENDWVIRCPRIMAGPLSEVFLPCELCPATVAATLDTAKKRGMAGWHVICEECCTTLLEAFRPQTSAAKV
jgi:hypothetical protein